MTFALTFDDGPGPSMPALLDVLAGAGCRATFFVLGRNVCEPAWGAASEARAMCVRAAREGHELANHSWSHVLPIDPDVFMDEVARCDELVSALRREASADPSARILVRLPFGEKPPDLRASELRAAGREPVGWTGALYDDWLPRDPIALCRELVSHTEACERTGITAVLTLHASGESPQIGFGRPWTVDAVRAFLAAARERGWRDVACPAPKTITAGA